MTPTGNSEKPQKNGYTNPDCPNRTACLSTGEHDGDPYLDCLACPNARAYKPPEVHEIAGCRLLFAAIFWSGCGLNRPNSVGDSGAKAALWHLTQLICRKPTSDAPLRFSFIQYPHQIEKKSQNSQKPTRNEQKRPTNGTF